ncbi:hypothetical protein EVAR_61658_1 [Eumeta japonica]|uniref:Uncharacterized protein n=1 Tax=Eumeta variegata TaxID=151549 RepID=A0A4C1Z4J5_EUMVA|nr:hypothetical protein EVAR_61658_1 [Eumeta japonica]
MVATRILIYNTNSSFRLHSRGSKPRRPFTMPSATPFMIAIPPSVLWLNLSCPLPYLCSVRVSIDLPPLISLTRLSRPARPCKYLIPTQEADKVMSKVVTNTLRSRASMGCDDYLFSGGSHARLPPKTP